MSLRDLLVVVSSVASEHHIREPFVVGGIARDIAMGSLENLNDIDLTNGERSISELADLVGQRLGIAPSVLSDGHKKLKWGKYSLDFSTNQIYPEIDTLLAQRGIKTINNMVRETYSRDFTINTLMTPLDFSKILDITAMGKYDISHKIIRCPLDPVVAITASPNRIVRAFYYAAKLGMTIDAGLKSAIGANLHLLEQVKSRYASDKLTEAIRLDSKIIDDLIETGVLGKLKLSKTMADELIRSRRLSEVI